MPTIDDLIPSSKYLREKLAENIHERRLLRALLRLAIRAHEVGAATQADRVTAYRAVSTPPGQGGAR